MTSRRDQFDEARAIFEEGVAIFEEAKERFDKLSAEIRQALAERRQLRAGAFGEEEEARRHLYRARQYVERALPTNDDGMPDAPSPTVVEFRKLRQFIDSVWGGDRADLSFVGINAWPAAPVELLVQVAHSLGLDYRDLSGIGVRVAGVFVGYWFAPLNEMSSYWEIEVTEDGKHAVQPLRWSAENGWDLSTYRSAVDLL